MLSLHATELKADEIEDDAPIVPLAEYADINEVSRPLKPLMLPEEWPILRKSG
jgi:hypothetical protein